MSEPIECCLDGLHGVFLYLPAECLRDLEGPGDVEEVARYWVARPEIAAQLDAIGHEGMVRALREYGVWDDAELADEEWTRLRAVWVASGSPSEEGEED